MKEGDISLRGGAPAATALAVLSDGARALLRRLVQGEQVEAGEPGRAELAALGLAVHNPQFDLWSVPDMHHAEQSALAAERAAIAHHLDRMMHFSELHREMRDAEPPTGNGIEFLGQHERVNAAIMQAVNSARSQVLTAQPLDRDRETLRAVSPSQVKLLQGASPCAPSTRTPPAPGTPSRSWPWR